MQMQVPLSLRERARAGRGLQLYRPRSKMTCFIQAQSASEEIAYIPRLRFGLGSTSPASSIDTFRCQRPSPRPSPGGRGELSPRASNRKASMSSPTQDLLRRIPSVNALLQEESLKPCTAGVPHRIVVQSLRAAIEATRAALMEGGTETIEDSVLRDAILARAKQEIQAAVGPHYRKVINATGIILHTALGRAALPAGRRAADRRRAVGLLAPPGGGRPAAAATSATPASSGCCGS